MNKILSALQIPYPFKTLFLEHFKDLCFKYQKTFS